MSQRFFISVPIVGQHATIIGAEAHHLANVMRAKQGDLVTLFDGSGYEFQSRIETINKARVEVSILERSAIDRESPVELTLAVALPKGDRQRWLVEKAVELGVANLVPLITERGVAQPSESAVARLQRTVIEAAKQCGRNRLLTIEPPRRWEEFASTIEPTAGLRWLAHPGGTPLGVAWSSAVDPPNRIISALGPEGGFTDEEVQKGAAAGWQLIDLGPRILRIETAAIAIASWAAFVGLRS